MIRNHSFRSNKGLSDASNTLRLEAFKLEKSLVLKRQYMDFVSFLMEVHIYDDARKVFNSLLAFKDVELQSKEWIQGIESTVLTNQIGEAISIYNQWMESVKFSKEAKPETEKTPDQNEKAP